MAQHLNVKQLNAFNYHVACQGLCYDGCSFLSAWLKLVLGTMQKPIKEIIDNKKKLTF